MENTETKKGNKIFGCIVVAVLLILSFFGGFLLTNKLYVKNGDEQSKQTETQKDAKASKQSNPKTGTDVSDDSTKTTTENKDDNKAVKEAITKVYNDAYNELYVQFEGESTLKDITYNKEKIQANLISEETLNKYFSENGVAYLIDQYADIYLDGVWYSTTDGRSFDPGTIFSATDAGPRELNVLFSSDNVVLAKALVSKNPEMGSTFGGEFILFVKEKSTWKIEMFQ